MASGASTQQGWEVSNSAVEVLTLEDAERITDEQNGQAYLAEKGGGTLQFKRSFTDFSVRRHKG